VANLPVNVSKVREAFKEVSDAAERSATILLAGDAGLVARAQGQFAGGGPTPATFSGSPADLGTLSTYPGELLVVLVSSQSEAETIASLDESRVQGAAVVAVDEGPGATGIITSLPGEVVRLSFSDTPDGWARLFAACAKVAAHDLVALGRRYPALRRYAARRVINHTAGQNAAVGLLVFLPGADMPAMTLNQIKMVLNLASLHDQKIGPDRALELVGVLGLALGFRALARRVVTRVPGFGWLYRGLIGYAATSALGAAAEKYFEMGAPASTGRVVALVRNLRH
jgi:uncharacterized protein (DUF697 family)